MLANGWPRGLMDKASDFGSEDCRFESCRGRKEESSSFGLSFLRNLIGLYGNPVADCHPSFTSGNTQIWRSNRTHIPRGSVPVKLLLYLLQLHGGGRKWWSISKNVPSLLTHPHTGREAGASFAGTPILNQLIRGNHRDSHLKARPFPLFILVNSDE